MTASQAINRPENAGLPLHPGFLNVFMTGRMI
jgi:hypothetical protein